MDIKDFFRVIIKVLGVIIIIIGVIPTLSSFFLYINEDIAMSFTLIGSFLLYGVLSYFFLLDSDFIIDKLKLTKNFDNDRFNFETIKSSLLLEISCIIIGLYAIITSLPTLLLEGFMYFKMNAQSSSIISLPIDSNNYFFIDLVYFFLALILIASRKQISKFLK